jgi:parallel beta-helix repeat protein
MNTTIFNNTISNTSSNGINVVQSDNVVIANNTCINNYYSGIWIDEESTNCSVVNNTLAFNGEGFEILESTTTEFALANGNGGGGIWITQGSSGNNILYNDLIDNYRNALDEVPGNYYSNNFWTDYTGVDTDGDNIGDTPYYVEGAGEAVDEYPRMISWSPYYTEPSMPEFDSMTLLISGGVVTLLVVIVVFMLKKCRNSRSLSKV